MAIRLDLGDIQGLFARGYREHRYARFTIFTIAEAPPAARCSSGCSRALRPRRLSPEMSPSRSRSPRPACASWDCRTTS